MLWEPVGAVCFCEGESCKTPDSLFGGDDVGVDTYEALVVLAVLKPRGRHECTCAKVSHVQHEGEEKIEGRWERYYYGGQLPVKVSFSR